MKTRTSPGSFVALVGIAALISLSSLPQNASAQDVTYTTTADFDGGTKNAPGDGNLGVETNTDNPGITTNQLEIASLKGDRFNTDDTDADTFKWNLRDESGVVDSLTRSISGGVLNLDVDCSGTCIRGIVTSGTFSGDFDVRAKLDIDTDTADTQQWEFGMFNAVGRCLGTDDGALYMRSDGNLVLFKCLNGALSQVGTNTAVPGDPVCLRIARTTSTTYTAYYATGDCSVWTSDEAFTDAGVTGAMYAHILGTSFLGGIVNADWDDFQLADGTVDAGGFRTSGNWISPAFTVPTDRRLATVDFTQTSTPPSICVDQVEVRSGGSVVATFGPGCPTGPLSPAGDFNGALDIRFYLIGTNAATPALTQVELTYGELAPAGGRATRPPIVLTCRIAWPSNLLRCVARENRGWFENAGGVTDRAFSVDGRTVARNTTTLEMPIDANLGEGVMSAHVRYTATGTTGATASAEATVTADSRPAYFGLPVAVLMVAFGSRYKRQRRGPT